MSYPSHFDIDPDEAGPRATLTPLPAMAVAAAFGLGTVAEIRDLRGTYGLNLLLRTTGGDYVLRAHRPWVTAEWLAAIQQTRVALGAMGLPVPPPSDRSSRPALGWTWRAG